MDTVEQEKFGSLATALAHANKLLATAPAKAEAQAREILKVVPANLQAIRLLSVALRVQGKTDTAREVVESATARFPDSALLQFERGLVLAELEATDQAIASLKKAVKLDPKSANAWLALADLLRVAGDRSGADAAYAEHIRA